MLRMKVDFRGRIRNTKLPYSQCLLPLMEAIVNSIQSIHESSTKQSGEIRITILRDCQKEINFDDVEKKLLPVRGFSIVDNGLGFNDKNLESFLTADTTHRLDLGGRGVGRFSWLKAFKRAHIESIFRNGKCSVRRKFFFSPTERGIEEYSTEELSSIIENSTTVVLEDYATNFKKYCPKSPETIALRIIEHCLEFFAFGNIPTILLLDECDSKVINLDLLFKENFAILTEKKFSVKEQAFSLRDVQVFRPHDIEHKINLCANQRVVQSISLSTRIPHTNSQLLDSSRGNFVYVAYVSGPFLDDSVNSERTDFTFFELDEEFPNKEEILSNAQVFIEEFVRPFTLESRKRSFERAQAYIASSSPAYRYLLEKRKTEIENLPISLSEQRIELELHKLHINEKTMIKEESSSLLSPENFESEEFFDENQKKIDDLFERLNDVVKSDLAEYVVQRKVILEYLRSLLDFKQDGGYQVEEALHKLIFPLRETSDTLDYHRHNLWLVDERLVYHQYLASDTPFSQQVGSPVAVSSEDRPDIVVFNKAFALNEGSYPIGSCVILEFKRPERNEYQDDKNPIFQVLNYVEEIRSGRAKDSRGATIEVPRSIPFYCYIIASITPKIRQYARLNSLIETHDGSGYYGYNTPIGAYIEVISYKKLIYDAKKRNQAFFDKLNL